MKPILDVYAIAAILICAAGALESQKPALRAGVSVQMPAAAHAVAVPAADEQDATVVAITAEGRVYAGVTPTEPGALGSLPAETVYVKADSRVPFQKVLAVLDALRGKSVVLLAASPTNMEKGEVVPPYGVKLTVSR